MFTSLKTTECLMWPAFHLHKSLTWFEIAQIMPEHMCSILKTCDKKLGWRWLLFYFVWTINFYSARDFAFGLSFIIQQQCWQLYARTMTVLWWIEISGIAYWCFFFVLEFIKFIMFVLIRFGWCVLILLWWLVACALCFWSYLCWRWEVSLRMEGF